MPLKSPKRNISDAENKLRVLFCVKCLGMATLEQLWPFVAQLELMEYVALCLYVDELVKDGTLLKGTHAVEGMLYLSQKGQEALLLFSDKLTWADQQRIEKAAPIYFARLIEHRQVRAVYERAEAGSYCVACAVREGDLPTLLLKLTTTSRAFATTASKNFSYCASALMMLLYTLTEPVNGVQNIVLEHAKALDAAMGQVTPEQPMLCTYGKHEYSIVVCLRDTAATYRLALLMSSLEAAQGWAQCAMANEKKLAAQITATLQKALMSKRQPQEGHAQ